MFNKPKLNLDCTGYSLRDGRLPKLGVLAGFTSSSLTSSSATAATGAETVEAAVVRDRPPYPPEVGLANRFFLSPSVVLDGSVVDGRF